MYIRVQWSMNNTVGHFWKYQLIETFIFKGKFFSIIKDTF